MAVDYEWCVETVVRETEDIEDNNFVSSFASAMSIAGEATEEDDREYKIVLVRTEGNQDDGVTDRLWAYFEDGLLPEFFANAYGNATSVKVPKKFHAEVSKLPA